MLTSTKANRKIIFVVHSLGGLVIQRALSTSRESRFHHLRIIETCTIGICFLGTPHHGSDLAKWGAVLTDIVNIVKPANHGIVKLLRRGSETLSNVQDSFHNVLEKRKQEGSNIEIVCFYEQLPVGKSFIVPKESAIITGELHYPIHANHMVSKDASRRKALANICKGHDKVLEFTTEGIQGYNSGNSKAAGIESGDGYIKIGDASESYQARLDSTHCILQNSTV